MEYVAFGLKTDCAIKIIITNSYYVHSNRGQLTENRTFLPTWLTERLFLQCVNLDTAVKLIQAIHACTTKRRDCRASEGTELQFNSKTKR